jgi:hypothetical protein
MLFDAHNHAFRVLGGVPRRGIYDNMRTAVDKIGRGKERQVNARFSAMVSHFLFEAEFCNPASGWEKGQIEKNVQDARHRLWQPMPDFPSLAALNGWLETRCTDRPIFRPVELERLARQKRQRHKHTATARLLFRAVFRQFVLLCRRLDLYGRELLDVDVTRIKAVNNKDRNFTGSSLREFIRAADERLDDYLARLDASDIDGATTSGAPMSIMAEPARSHWRASGDPRPMAA